MVIDILFFSHQSHRGKSHALKHHLQQLSQTYAFYLHALACDKKPDLKIYLFHLKNFKQ